MSSTIFHARTLLSHCTFYSYKVGRPYFYSWQIQKHSSYQRKVCEHLPVSVSSPIEPSDFISFIPSIHSRPVKFLGSAINGSISESL